MSMAGTPIEILIKALGAEEVVAALKKVTAEGAVVKQKLAETGTEFDKLGTKAKGPLGNISTELTKTSQSTNQFKGVLTSTNPTLQTFKTSFDQAASGAPKLTTALDQTATKTATLTERGRGLSTSFQGLMTSTVALTGTAITLFETWDSVSDAELNVAKARNSLEQATIRLHSFEAQRNKLIEEGKTGTEQYAIVEEKLALQHQKVEAATGTLQNAEENLAIIQTHFYKEIIPLTIAASASMFDLFSKGKAGITEMGKSFSGLIPAIKGAASSFSLISLTNPFFIALTIGGAIIGAFVTNLFGFRDAVNSVGKAIGDAVPFLRPFLDMLGAAGKFLTDTFNGGAQSAEAFGGTVSETMDGATTSFEGFEDGATTALDGVATATGGLVTATDTAVTGVKGYLAQLTEEYEKTKKQLDTIFTKTVDLGDGIKLSGFRQDPNSPSNLGKETSDRNMRSFFAGSSVSGQTIADMERLTEVTTMFDATTGKLHVNANQLNKAMTDLNFTDQQRVNVLEALLGPMKAVSETTSRNVSGSQELTKTYNQGMGTLRQLSTQVDLAQVPLKGLAASMVGVTTGVQGFVAAAPKQVAAQTMLTGTLAELNKKHNELFTLSKSATLQQDLLAVATKQVQVDFMSMSMATTQQNLYLQEYNKVLDTTLGQTVHFQKGVVAQRQALLDSKIQVLESAGAYSELQKQMETGQPQAVAFAQAFYDQKTAFEQSKIETFALQGTLAALIGQYDSGQASVIAFNTAFLEQKKSLIDTAIAVDTTRGTIAALTEDMAAGGAQAVFWNKGLAEGRLATIQQGLALEEAAGSLQAYNESIASGAASTQAFTQGALEMTRSVAEAFVALDNSRGALAAYTELVNQGIPQYNAYNQAILDAQMANAKLNETMFGMLGTYKTQLKAFRDSNIEIDKNSIAFLQGKDAALQWAEGIKASEFALGGMIRGLDAVATELGSTLPGNIRLTEESAKRLIVAFGDVVTASAEMASAGFKAGMELTSGVADALRSEDGDVDDALDELADKFGIDFPDSVKEGITSANLGKVMSDELDEVINVARVAFEGGADQVDVEKMVDDIGAKFQDRFNNLTPKMRESAKGVMSQINYELQQGPDKNDPNGVENWFNRLQAYALALPDQIDPAAMAIKNLANIDFSDAVEQLNAYKSALDGTIAAFKNVNFGSPQKNIDAYNKSLEGQGIYDSVTSFDKNGNPISGDVDSGSLPGTKQVDTSAIDAAQAKLDAFNLNLAQLPNTITTVVGQANTAFLPLADPLLNEIPTKVLNFSTTLSGISQFITESVVVPANNALLTLGDPFLNEIPAKILQFSQTLAQMPGFVQSSVVTPIVGAFNAMATTLQSGPFAKIQRDAANAFVAITGAARAEAPKLTSVYDSAFQAMLQKFSSFQQTAQQVFRNITQSANDSRNAVVSLANSINNLQNKTVTITTINRTVNETVNAAVGFGPSIVTHPTRLLVGESGPEFVNVTPLSSAANQNLSPNQRLEMYGDPGKTRSNTAPLFEMATGNQQYTDAFGNHYNYQSDVNTNSNVQTNTGQNLNSNDINSLPNGVDPFPNAGEDDWVDVNIVAVGGRNVSTTGNALPIYGSGGTGGSSGGGSTGGGSTGGGTVGGGGTAGGNQNFNYQSNGKFYRYTNGQVETNMSESEIAAAEAQLGYKFPRGTGGTVPSGGTGTPGTGGTGGTPTTPTGEFNFPTNIGGVTFPAGFPFHEVPNPITGQLGGSTGSVSTGGSGVQQSQHVSQNSSVNQGNNSNIDLMSGTNSRLRIQNGVVVEATGIYAGYKIGDPLPGFGGIGGLGPGTAGMGSILEPIRGRYRSGQDNQFGIFDHGPAAGMYDVGTPCRLDDILDGGAGSGGGLNGLTDILQLFLNLLKNFTMPFNINTILDGNVVYKNSVKRYMGNLGTFLN